MSTVAPRDTHDPVASVMDVPRYITTVIYGFLGATWLSIALGIGFFVYGGIFGPLSDAGALLVAIFLWFVVRAVYDRSRDDGTSRAVFWVGVGAVATSLLGSLGLIIGTVVGVGLGGGVFLGVQFLGILLQGTWLLGVGYVGLRGAAIGRRTSWAGIAAGAGMAVGIVALVYSYSVGTFSILVTLGGLLYVIGISLFAVWLARDFGSARGGVVG